LDHPITVTTRANYQRCIALDIEVIERGSQRGSTKVAYRRRQLVTEAGFAAGVYPSRITRRRPGLIETTRPATFSTSRVRWADIAAGNG
jgi:hypothetical protein